MIKNVLQNVYFALKYMDCVKGSYDDWMMAAMICIHLVSNKLQLQEHTNNYRKTVSHIFFLSKKTNRCWFVVLIKNQQSRIF